MEPSVDRRDLVRRYLVLIVAWLGVFAVGATLRLHDLGTRPIHCDEATGARLLAERMESGRSQFDPTHFHGPIQSMLAAPLCQWRGETTWRELSTGTLRLLPAAAGILTLLLPLLGRRRWGDAPMLLAAALLAVSPLLVYYSRMFIHETLLGCAGLLALLALLRFPRHGLPGLFVALMFAAKESFIISLIAWTCAALALAAWQWRDPERAALPDLWRLHRSAAAWSLGVFVVTTLAIYSEGFTQPQGLLDAVRTIFVYQTGPGHDRSFLYYPELLLWPRKAAGLWWYGTPVAVLALVAVARSLRPGGMDRGTRLTVLFIALGAAAHFVGYGLIAYKTPWLMVFPWIQVCLVAGFAVAGFDWRKSRPASALLAVLIVLTLGTQFRQTRFANGRFASDGRNPFACVPTRRNIEGVGEWLQQVAKVAPGGTVEPIGVVGREYWPLPWYLRPFDTIGYWPQDPPAKIAGLPVVFVMPEAESAATECLQANHMALPRGLRDNVSVTLYLRNDLWQAWREDGRP